jgi:hypothetical protein
VLWMLRSPDAERENDNSVILVDFERSELEGICGRSIWVILRNYFLFYRLTSFLKMVFTFHFFPRYSEIIAI